MVRPTTRRIDFSGENGYGRKYASSRADCERYRDIPPIINGTTEGYRKSVGAVQTPTPSGKAHKKKIQKATTVNPSRDQPLPNQRRIGAMTFAPNKHRNK